MYSGQYGNGGGSSYGGDYERAIRQRESSYNQPQQSGYGQGLRMPAPQQQQAPMQSPQQQMGGAPMMPQATSVYMGRMPTNGMQAQGAMPAAQPQGGGVGAIRDAIRPQQGQGGSWTDQIGQLPPEMQERWNQYNQSLYAGPDYKGRHETAQMLSAQYARMLMEQAASPQIDFSGGSVIGDQFENSREQMANNLAARGMSGNDAQGAIAMSYGNQAKAVGGFARDQQEQRRREQLQQQIAFENWARGIEGQGLQRNWGEQDAPSFLDKALGVVGGIAGSLIPGGAGGVIKNVAGAFGGGDNHPTQMGDQYGPGFGYGGGQDYAPVDWDEEYASGRY